jgi:hypothetical protein
LIAADEPTKALGIDELLASVKGEVAPGVRVQRDPTKRLSPESSPSRSSPPHLALLA